MINTNQNNRKDAKNVHINNIHTQVDSSRLTNYMFHKKINKQKRNKIV